MRILCVEDDADSREMMTVILEQAGYEVVAASNPADGLKIAKHDAPALIILDNWYERGSGIELCKQIRQFDSHTPIIFYSGAVYQSDIQNAMEAGAQDYLIKPTGIQVLVKTVEGLTRRTSRRSVVGKGRVIISVSGREDIMALDDRIEAEAKALREKLDKHADLPEVEEVVTNLNELLQTREHTQAILARLECRNA